MKYKVGYIGNMYEASEYIFYNENINIEVIICEKEKLSNDLITISLVRNIKLEIINNKSDIIKIFNLYKDRVDFFIMCSFGIKIPIECIETNDVYNIHYSDLPKYKGRHPLYWATINNEKYIGISIHKVNEEIDSGEIVAKEEVPYYIWMNDGDIFKSLTNKIPKLLNKLVSYIKGDLDKIENTKGDYYPMVSRKNIAINLEIDKPVDIFNKARAQYSYKGARLEYKNNIYWVKKVEFSFEENFDENIISIKYDNKVWINLLEFEMEKSDKNEI